MPFNKFFIGLIQSCGLCSRQGTLVYSLGVGSKGPCLGEVPRHQIKCCLCSWNSFQILCQLLLVTILSINSRFVI